MKVKKYIEVRLLKKRLTPVIDVVQYDTGIQLVFSLVDFDIPDGTTATLYVQKRSGKFVYQEENITIDGNEITIDLENQALTEHGETKYQVMLSKDSDKITTFAGVLRVEKSLADSGAVESTTVIRAFDEAVADHVAEFQTKAEQIVAACIATIPDDYTVMEAKVNELANAIKGNLSGVVAFADDVSPVEHNPAVWVHGKNLFNYDAWKGLDAIKGEITYSDDGVVTLTATEDDCFTNYGLYPVAARVPVQVGQPVTISWETDADETMTSGLVYMFANGAADFFQSATATTKKLTFIPPTGCEFVTFRLGVSVTGDSITYWNIQIEYGDIATDYEAYIDPSTVTVNVCGKNLIPPHESNTQNGYTVTKNSNGSVTVSGASTTDGAIYLNLSSVIENPFVLHKGVKYSFTWASNNVRSGYLKLVGVDGTNKWLTAPIGSIVLNGDDYAQIVQLYTQIGANSASDPNAVGDTSLCGKYYFQLEVGEESTDFEKYTTPTEYIPSSDGTVSGLTSLSPNMTILTDTDGAIVECEYNRDTNKVIDKLINAITALGGTV